jgi:hypothetical protein
VTLFTVQLTQLKTQVHAMGFFNVSKHLFPSVLYKFIDFSILIHILTIDSFFSNNLADRDNVDLLFHPATVSFRWEIITDVTWYIPCFLSVCCWLTKNDLENKGKYIQMRKLRKITHIVWFRPRLLALIQILIDKRHFPSLSARHRMDWNTLFICNKR